jgi:hypothetical protein
MTVELKGKPEPLRLALSLNLLNLVHAVLDSPLVATRIRIGTLAEDRSTVITRGGTIRVGRADALPGEKVVVYEV